MIHVLHRPSPARALKLVAYQLKAAMIATSPSIRCTVAVFAASMTLLGGAAINHFRSGHSEAVLVANAVLSASALAATAIDMSDSFLRPVGGDVVSHFGPRWDRMHAGVDLQASAGDPIRASKPGTVMVESCGSGYGTCSMIDHGDGLVTLYAHMSAKLVEHGPVDRGQIIGYVGCTGRCTGPHLHFEIREHGTRINPLERRITGPG